MCLPSRHPPSPSHPSKNLLSLPLRHLRTSLRLLTLFRPNSFINRNNHRSSLSSRLDSIDLNKCRFPNELFEIIGNTFRLNVHTCPGFSSGMTHTEFI